MPWDEVEALQRPSPADALRIVMPGPTRRTNRKHDRRPAVMGLDFRAQWSKRLRSEAVHYAFDLIEHDGDNRRGLPLLARKRLEGTVSKRIHAPYRSGCSQTWLECKDPCRTERARGRVASVVATGRGPVPTVAIASGRLTGIISGMSWTPQRLQSPEALRPRQHARHGRARCADLLRQPAEVLPPSPAEPRRLRLRDFRRSVASYGLQRVRSPRR